MIIYTSASQPLYFHALLQHFKVFECSPISEYAIHPKISTFQHFVITMKQSFIGHNSININILT